MSTRQTLSVATGSYTDRDGNEKSTWTKIGTLVTKGDDKQFISLEDRVCNYLKLPLGSSFTGFVNVLPPQDNQQKKKANVDNDVPF